MKKFRFHVLNEMSVQQGDLVGWDYWRRKKKEKNLNLSQCWGKLSKNETKIWIHRKISDGRR